MSELISPSLEVAAALSQGKPVVALESSVWVQGLPWPHNWQACQEVEAAVREEGAVPAVLWVDEGLIYVGLSDRVLESLCREPRGSKLNVADLPAALAQRQPGATTVSASLRIAEKVGLKVFATGGIGGVHRGWQEHADVSADLYELARSPVLTVCAGAKCVLDLPATWEVLETLAVPVYRYATDYFPEFYRPGSSSRLGSRIDGAAEVASASQISLELLGKAGLVVQDPPSSLPAEQLDHWLEEGLKQAPASGKEVTPFLLGWLGKASAGKTLDINRQLLVANARLAAKIARQF